MSQCLKQKDGGNDSVIYCALGRGHKEPRTDGYGNESGEWYDRDDAEQLDVIDSLRAEVAELRRRIRVARHIEATRRDASWTLDLANALDLRKPLKAGRR